MLQRPAFLLSCALLLLGSCGHSRLSLPGFDAAAWRRDVRGCAGQRQAQLAALDQHREELYNVHVDAVADLLGRPDEEELQEQTQRVYYYYVAPGPQCAPGHPAAATRRLSVRFGSLGTVTEVLYTAPAGVQ
ncbi:hypothetical protein [Hymenobacter jeollabukensis]|uniref:Uncharacterized protein n=1 Tax=Hymenobacter jeollabukensis TaxID=2025313 RepID=A0A5R8WVE2_9BACT|nr:hypothetical protein [Hymenobacter jeollabukensis]TLM96481.1 hypothetical protein FDY95_00330 [Hymenobacter jeollabukensis]